LEIKIVFHIHKNLDILVSVNGKLFYFGSTDQKKFEKQECLEREEVGVLASWLVLWTPG